MTLDISTLEKTLEAKRTQIVWALDLTTYDADTDTTAVRRYSTLDFWTSAVDSVAPGVRYHGRLLPPSLRWSLVSGATGVGASTSGASSSGEARLEIVDLTGLDSDIVTSALTVENQPQTLRLGHPGLDLGDWQAFHYTARKIRPTDGRWLLELRDLDHRLDQEIPRHRLWGLGGCLDFDGSHRAEVAHSGLLTTTSPLQVSAIVEPRSTSSDGIIACKGTSLAVCDWALWISATDGKVRWWVRNTSGAVQSAIAPEAVGLGEKARWTGEFDGSELRLLKDGAVVTTTTWSATLQSGTDPIGIGGAPGGTKLFDGKLDDFQLWTTDAPTATESSDWAQRELPKAEHSRPKLYLRMNEGSGTTSFDDSLRGHDATLSGPTPEDMWSTLGEGAPSQLGELAAMALGSRLRVPGHPLGNGVYQVGRALPSETTPQPLRGVGPIDEGGAFLRPRRTWTSTDLTITTSSGISASLPVDTITTGGDIDLGGLIRHQYLQVDTPTQNHVVRVMGRSTETTIRVEGGVLSAEAPGGSFTLTTTGFVGTATDVSFSTTNSTISSPGQLRFIGLLAGHTFTVSGSASNDGSYTLAEDATVSTLTTVEPLTLEGAGPSVTITFDEAFDYDVDLERREVQLTTSRELAAPLAIAFRGPSNAGTTRSSVLKWLAEAAGLSADTTVYDQFAAADPEPAGLWVGPDEEPTWRDVCDRLVAAGATHGTNLRTALHEAALRKLPGTPALELTYPKDFVRLERVDTPNPINRQTVHYAPNDVELGPDDVVGIALDRGLGDPDYAAYAQRPHLTATAEASETQQARHPLADDPPELEAPHTTEAGGQAMANHVVELDGADRGVWRATLPLSFATLDWRADSIRVTSPDHPGLESGRDLVALLIEITDNLATLYLWG